MLICLVVVTMLSGALLKVGLAHRDAERAHERRLQAQWLAQAGVDRALFRLAESAGYVGETWQLKDENLAQCRAAAAAGAPSALVRIKVKSSPRGPQARLIKIQADYPPDPPLRARHSLELEVELGLLKRGVAR
jgi:type II secretory pathway component PulK